ncbi:MAG TPA: hypothetical protein VFR14_09310 [Candidatus Limnocylindrales bacterium]|nr:hypothetical protein [Candidatus Limnocylindrales bacterium]
MSARRRSIAALGARALSVVALLGLIAARPVAAADPSAAPSPMVFHNPQYLVFMESHQTYNGPVVDNAYWLYVAPPDEDGHFAVPDGTGGVFHYQGRLVGGPFAGEADACPAMLAVGVESLQAWIVAAGESAQIVDCRAYRATEPPVPTGDGPTDGSTDGAPPDVTEAGGTDADDIGLALALVGALLLGGGAAGTIAAGRGEAARRPPKEPEPTSDPCAEQEAAVARASATGRYLNDLLASSRRYHALIEREIDVLAGLVLPGSVLLDLGFLAGSLSGAAGPKIVVTRSFLGALGESVAKDVAKELGKQALGSAGEALDPGAVGSEGGLSATKQVLLTAIRDSIVNRRFFGELSPAGPTRVFRDYGASRAFEQELEGFADSVAGPIADGVGALLDLYNGVVDGLALKVKLDTLRMTRDRLADEIVGLEVRLEDALDEQRFAADRLAHCRTINAPGWRP